MDKSKKVTFNPINLIENENFIIFGEDFARYPNPLEHMLRPLFDKNNFIWVETIGLRAPRLSLYDFRRIVEKLSKWFTYQPKSSAQSPIPTNIFVITPLMIPFTKYKCVRNFNKWNVIRKTKQALKAQNIVDPITVVSVPNACDFVGAFHEKLKVYYCSDEFSLWPGLDTDLVHQFEKKLIANVDVIIGTSELLTKTKIIPGKKTPLITHGVEFDHFNIGPNKVKNLKIKLCYFGLFDERSDQIILKDIATSLPDCEIHIVGNVVCSTRTLQECSNVIFHGKIDYQKLPLAISEMDMFLLPYVRNELTDNINPLKLKEYLLTGRPVIATHLPEVVKFKNYLFLGKDSQEFISIINHLKKEKTLPYSDIVIEHIEKYETWSAKARAFSEVLQNQI